MSAAGRGQLLTHRVTNREVQTMLRTMRDRELLTKGSEIVRAFPPRLSRLRGEACPSPRSLNGTHHSVTAEQSDRVRGPRTFWVASFCRRHTQRAQITWAQVPGPPRAAATRPQAGHPAGQGLGWPRSRFPPWPGQPRHTRQRNLTIKAPARLRTGSSVARGFFIFVCFIKVDEIKGKH